MLGARGQCWHTLSDKHMDPGAHRVGRGAWPEDFCLFTPTLSKPRNKRIYQRSQTELETVWDGLWLQQEALPVLTLQRCEAASQKDTYGAAKLRETDLTETDTNSLSQKQISNFLVSPHSWNFQEEGGS